MKSAGEPAPSSVRHIQRQDLSRRLEQSLVIVALVALILSANGDIYRITFYADDLLFLDAARRFPLWDVLLGQHGIYPWYRPLSRELFFYVLLLAGPFATVLAHTLSLLCMLLVSVSLLAIGGAYRAHAAAACAVVFLVTNSYTKFLLSWASGFQDILAITLLLGSVASHLRGGRRLAACLAALAPFAKESAFLVFPLLAVANALSQTRQRWRGFLALYLPGFALAVLLHLLARAAWETGGSTAVHTPSLTALIASVLRSLAAFTPWVHPLEGIPSLNLPSLAGAVAALLLVATFAVRSGGSNRTALLALAASGVALAVVPMSVAHLLGLIGAPAYYFYSALPWAALVLGLVSAQFGRRAAACVAALVAMLNIAASSYRQPNLASLDAWTRSEPSWTEAVRVSAVTERFAVDIRRELASRPESVVVLYTGLPYGVFFQQSLDGPATREFLRDPTARAFYISEAPRGFDPSRMVIVGFDTTSFRLRRIAPTLPNVFNGLASSVASGRYPIGRTWLSYADQPTRAAPDIEYLSCALVLLELGPDAYRFAIEDAQRRMVQDRDAARWTPEPAGSEVHGMDWLSAPAARLLTGSAHFASAESLFRRNLPRAAAAEYRVALALGSDDSEVRLKLGILLLETGATSPAAQHLRNAVALGRPGWAAEAAQQLLKDMHGTTE